MNRVRYYSKENMDCAMGILESHGLTEVGNKFVYNGDIWEVLYKPDNINDLGITLNIYDMTHNIIRPDELIYINPLDVIDGSAQVLADFKPIEN